MRARSRTSQSAPAAVALLLASCGPGESNPGCVGEGCTESCVLGASVACACADGRSGVGRCGPHGEVWRCDCEDFPDGSLVAIDGVVVREDGPILDLGAVAYGETETRAVRVKNLARWPMEVAVSSTDLHYRFDRTEFRIGAGEEALLEVSFDATAPYFDETAEVTLAFDGGELELGLHARVALPSLTCTPSTVEFGWVDVGQDARAAVVCRNDGVNAHRLDARVQAPFTAGLARAEVPAGASLTVTLRYRPTRPVSLELGRLELRAGSGLVETIQLQGRSRQEGSGPPQRSCDPVPIESAWEALALGKLDREVRCGELTPERAARVADRLHVPEVAEELRLVESGELAYDPVRWGCCIESLARLPCWVDTYEWTRAGCDRPFVGARGSAEACTDLFSCRGGHCPYHVCNPTCEESEWADLGEPCGDGFKPCWEYAGWACRQGRCSPRAGPGEACAKDGECEEGHACERGACALVPAAGPGEPCASNNLHEPGLPDAPRCADGFCMDIDWSGTGLGTCRPWPAAGEPCLWDDGGCRVSHFCLDGTCVERTPEGAPCIDPPGYGDACERYSWCQPTTGTCGQPPTAGEACVESCSGGPCIDGVCRPMPEGLGEPCADDGVCDMDKVCVDGACTWACGEEP